ncbi:hypothetical protein ACFYY8_35315 [Streptosporangium sp. NPDC001559]|uniref:hypothetical protein n=1 Tax=Streptosporangium sp. NPDC001559 TaxID=3366187 RepID=UPI0036E69F1B
MPAGTFVTFGAPAAGDSATTAPKVPAARTEYEASRQARDDRQRVEVSSLRTENRQVFANPDGSFTSETSAPPERVRRDDAAGRHRRGRAFGGDDLAGEPAEAGAGRGHRDLRRGAARR